MVGTIKGESGEDMRYAVLAERQLFSIIFSKRQA